MNEIIQSLLDRKSVRAYTDQEISEENVQLILNAAKSIWKHISLTVHLLFPPVMIDS